MNFLFLKNCFLPLSKAEIIELEVYHTKFFEKDSVKLVFFLKVCLEKVLIYYQADLNAYWYARKTVKLGFSFIWNYLHISRKSFTVACRIRVTRFDFDWICKQIITCKNIYFTLKTNYKCIIWESLNVGFEYLRKTLKFGVNCRIK